MFDDLLEKIKQIMASRLIPIFIVLVALFSILVARLFEIQIIDGQDKSKVSSLQDTITTYTDASRGLIRAYDGEILADNELVYTVELHDVLSTNKEKNDMLAYLIETLKEYGNEIEVTFPLSYDGRSLSFTASGRVLNTFKTNAFAQGKLSDEQAKAGPAEIFNYMREDRFYIDEEYSIEEALEIMSLRYASYVMWPPQNPVIICSDVNEETVVAIKERQAKLQGVNIGKQSQRYYIEDNEPFAHLLGYTGLISESELNKYKEEDENKYDSFDIVGKAGVEKAFKSFLKGEKGVNTLAVNGLGRPTEVLSSQEPVAGSDLYLTIEPELQRAIYQIVEQNLSGILLSKINNSKNAGTRGESSSNIRIPIYDVYYAFINNEIIDTKHFSAKDATDLEKNIQEKFTNKLEDVFGQLEKVLALDSTTTNRQLSKEMEEYISYINNLIDNNNIIIKDEVDKNNNIYIQYDNDRISLSEYLQHGISNNWINLDKLNVDNEYYDTSELYRKLLDYIKELLYDAKDFHKIIYYYLIDSYKISGTEISLLLFDQGVLEYNEEEVTRLQNGSISSFKFITDKIRSLDITPAQLGLEPFSASVVVTDVNTGKVKSLVSYPSYDSNNYRDYLSNELTAPLYPRATSEAIAPGSTFKMISSVAGLEEGVITPYEKIRDEYIFTKRSTINPPKCHRNNHGRVNLAEALEVSCNYYFYEVAYRLATRPGEFVDNQGLDSIGHYAKMFGLGQEARSNIEQEISATSYTSVSKNDSIRTAIGQGSNIFTPTELATYVTTIANRGKRFDLTVIDKIYNGKEYVDNKASYTQLDEISDSTWDHIQHGMYLVANGSKGSTRSLFSALSDHGIEVAGKTGTSQISRFNANHALFVSYGPYENPEISVTVVIPNGYTSGNAAELARDVYAYYYQVDTDILSGEAAEPEADTPAFSD